MVSDVAGDHDSKSQESTTGDFGAPHCSRFFSYSSSASRCSCSCSCSSRSSIAIRLIGPQVTANRLDQRSAQFKQPSKTSTVSLSTVRRGGLSTSTTKSDAKQEQSFNPQPTARKSLFCAQVVLRIATIRTRWDLSSTNVKSVVAEEESVTVATIRFDYDYEHRPPRRTKHEYDEIRCEARSLRISLHTRPRTLVLKATVNKGPHMLARAPVMKAQIQRRTLHAVG